MAEIVHVVMGGGVVLAAYRRSDFATAHARCVTGTTVTAFDTSSLAGELRALIALEIREALPPEIKIDIEIEWELGDEVTPAVMVSMDDIDDA